MARRLEKTPEFGGHPVGAASLPGCVRPVARPYLARGVPARPSRAFFIHEQRGRGFLGALVDRYRRGASVTAQCAPLSTSLLSATAARPPAAVACRGRA